LFGIYLNMRLIILMLEAEKKAILAPNLHLSKD